MRLFITKKGEKIIEEIKQDSRSNSQSIRQQAKDLANLAKTQNIYGTQTNTSQLFQMKLHQTGFTNINKSRYLQFNTIQTNNTEISIQNQSQLKQNQTNASLSHLPKITEYSPKVVRGQKLQEEDFDPQKIAFSSSKNPDSRLEIDDIIPISINQPKIRLSRHKKQKMLEYSSQQQLDYSNDSPNSGQATSQEKEDLSPSRFNNQNKLSQNFPTIEGRIRESMGEIKKRQTYQKIQNPQRLSVYHENYFDSRQEEFQRKQQPRNRYLPNAQSMSFGDYQKLRTSSVSIKTEQDISREKALKELRDCKLSEKMVATEMLRNQIIERIRLKSTLSVYKEQRQGTVQIQEELNWCNELKDQEKTQNQIAATKLFRETLMKQRKVERLKTRTLNKYNSYWQKYSSRNDFQSQKYQTMQINQSNNEYNVPAKNPKEKELLAQKRQFSQVSTKDLTSKQ